MTTQRKQVAERKALRAQFALEFAKVLYAMPLGRLRTEFSSTANLSLDEDVDVTEMAVDMADILIEELNK